ncbi:MAG TPA: SDR family oxidoreductase [Longimicrobiales bacterium]|nr:SDR family oxidoreductase [Longimicrobiales bacterium]
MYDGLNCGPPAHTPARVLVAGCGYVGCALAARLAGEGHAVWGLRRSTGALPTGVQPIAADLAVPSTLAGLPLSLDYVVYAAAPGGADDERYRTIYVDGLRNLLAALESQDQRPRRVLLTSTTGVYGQQAGEWVDEDSPTEPEDFRGERPLEGERLLLAGPFPATVLRLGGIYGPGRTRLIEQVRSGQARCVPGLWSNRIHRDDCAGALRHLMLMEDASPRYLGVDREPVELCDVHRWLAARLGVVPPVVDEDADPSGSAPGRRRRSNKRCSSERLVASGYRFLFPTFREGYAALLAGEAGA